MGALSLIWADLLSSTAMFYIHLLERMSEGWNVSGMMYGA